MSEANQAGPSPVAASRTTAQLTREGFAYVVVALFVAAAALLRNINLLILLNGLMIAPLLLSWRVCGSSLRRLVLRRVARQCWYAGRPDAIHWEAFNPHWFLPAWQVLIEDRLVAETAVPDGPAVAVRTRLMMELVGPGRHRTVSWRVLFPQRGLFRAGPARAQTSFPFGLIRANRPLDLTTTVVVAPAPGRLVAGWDRRLVSRAIGDSAVKRRAGLQGDEFFAVRPWRNGDSQRLIHWRSTARQGRPMVRQLDRRSDRDLIVVIDLWQQHPPHPPSGQVFDAATDPCELALSFAMSAVLMAERETRGQIIVAVCGETTRVVVSRPEAGDQGLSEIHEVLATAAPSGSPDVGSALAELANLTQAGSPVYLVSTRPVPGTILFELDDQMAPALAQLQPWLRIVAPGTPEFEQIFTPARMAADDDPAGRSAMPKSPADLQPPSAVRETRV